MPFRKRTYAIILLAVFSMVTFHDLLPHAHHAHEDASAHSEHHKDHHESDRGGVLSLLGHVLHLHEHDHPDCEIDVCPEIPAIKRNDKVIKDNSASAPAILNAGQAQVDISSSEISPARTYTSHSDAFLKDISLRGPPSEDC